MGVYIYIYNDTCIYKFDDDEDSTCLHAWRAHASFVVLQVIVFQFQLHRMARTAIGTITLALFPVRE